MKLRKRNLLFKSQINKFLNSFQEIINQIIENKNIEKHLELIIQSQSNSNIIKETINIDITNNNLFFINFFIKYLFFIYLF